VHALLGAHAHEDVDVSRLAAYRAAFGGTWEAIMKRLFAPLLALAALVGLAAPTQAAPPVLTYTGELTAANGLPYTGEVSVITRIFNAESGGTEVWAQGPEDIEVMHGALGVDLMGNAALWSALEGSNTLYLEFEVDGEPMLPRQRLTSVPYASVARNAERLGGLTSAELLSQASAAEVPPSKLPDSGLDDVSLGALSNELQNLNVTVNPNTPIADFNVTPTTVVADAIVTEPAIGYATTVEIAVNFTVTITSNLTIQLVPPAPLQAASGQTTFTIRPAQTYEPQTYSFVYSDANTPELAALLGHPLQGLWSVAITDNDNTLPAANQVGSITLFRVQYNAVSGSDVQVKKNLTVDGTLTVKQAMITPSLPVTVYRHEGTTSVGLNSNFNSVYAGSTITFTLDSPKMVQFNMQIGGDCGGASYVGAQLRIDGQQIPGLTNIDSCQSYWNIDATRTQLMSAGTHTAAIHTSFSGGSPTSYHDEWRTRYLEVVVFGSN
jgi:subtilisin-like proprotein convertase family protein